MNPLSNMFGNQMPQRPPVQNNPMMNAMNTMQQFNQFRQNFSGDPRQTVMNLLSSGRLNQGQFNQFAQAYQQFASMFQNRR